MPDPLLHRSVLDGSIFIPPTGDEARIRLEALPEGHLLHVLGPVDTAFITDCLVKAGLSSCSIRKAGFRQWFVVGDETLSAAGLAAFNAALAGKAHVTDQSHGRVRIAVSGRCARSALAKGTAVDLDERAFPEGSAAMTLIGHIPAQLVLTGPDRFELTVLRSFAESLWDDLLHMAVAASRAADAPSLRVKGGC